MRIIKKHKLLIFNLFLIVPFVVCILVFEVYLRIQHNKEHNNLLYSSHKQTELCTQQSQNQELIYTLTPNKCETNSQGYRDYAYSYDKKMGVFRIIIIGDSVAKGHGVKLEESFGKVLERNLNALPGKRKFEVIVLAQSGYSTSQELILLEEESFKYNPDIILWSYVMNDPAHPVHHNANGLLGRYFYKPKFYVLHYISKKIFELQEQHRKKNCKKEFHLMLHCAYREEVENNLHRIGEISKEKQIPIIFLLHPIFEKHRTFQNSKLVPLYVRLKTMASQEGMLPVDLVEAYKAYTMDELRQIKSHGYDPWHPNSKGHQVIAEHLTNVLRF